MTHYNKTLKVLEEEGRREGGGRRSLKYYVVLSKTLHFSGEFIVLQYISL